MTRGVVKYVPIDNCPDPNYPTTVPNAPVTKAGVPAAPEAPPTGSNVPNLYIEQASVISARFSNMKVGYFKLDLTNTTSNLYGEATEKWFFPPVEIRCLIERGTVTNTDTEYGVEVSQTITVTLPITNLQNLGFTPEVGDIISDQEKYYEVNSIDKQFITLPGTGASESTLGTPGQIILFVASAYLTRTSKLNLIKYSV